MFKQCFNSHWPTVSPLKSQSKASANPLAQCYCYCCCCCSCYCFAGFFFLVVDYHKNVFLSKSIQVCVYSLRINNNMTQNILVQIKSSHAHMYKAHCFHKHEGAYIDGNTDTSVMPYYDIYSFPSTLLKQRTEITLGVLYRYHITQSLLRPPVFLPSRNLCQPIPPFLYTLPLP